MQGSAEREGARAGARPRCGLGLSLGLWLAAGWAVLAGVPARAEVTLLLEEPIGLLARFSATGHATLLVSALCSDDHRRMRWCRPGETGSVLGRYHRVNGYDWFATEPEGYLYGADSAEDVTAGASAEQVSELRDRYAAEHVEEFPKGLRPTLWQEMVGVAYRRQIVVIRLRTTPEQDARLLAWLNASRNRSHFNLFYNNCADFVRQVLNVVYPGAVHRSVLYDAGITTPKQLADSMRRYARRHPEVGFEVRLLPQVPGELPRSVRTYGVTESFVKRTPWALPLVVLNPLEFGGVIASGVLDPRWNVNRAAKTASVWMGPSETAAERATVTGTASKPAD